MGTAFLTAEWRYLVMLNYSVDRTLLEPRVPAGTILDTYQGKAYLSVVGFLFQKTRVRGWSVPFHTDFVEVNLRFYVRRFSGDEWRRGVVFIKEIVPKRAIAMVARAFYNENYVCWPMRHSLELRGEAGPAQARYEWKMNGRWSALSARTKGEPMEIAPGSLEEFITEHYWGYAAQTDGGCMEYQVEHPRWRLWRATEALLDCDAEALYGTAFVPTLREPPSSAFLAEGSPVTVYRGVRI